MRRAHRPDQKEVRRKAILAGAAGLFSDCRYAELHMADLARRLDLAKGTLYLYFPSKEALFLAVLKDEMGAWFEGATARLAALEGGGADASGPLADALVDEMMAHPRLPNLQALVHGVLEQNVPTAEALAYARFLHAGVARVAELLEGRLPGLRPGRGAEFLIRFYALVIGTRLMSSRPPAVREALRSPELKAFDFDFEGIFRPAVRELLAGMLEPALVRP
ncbi:TetR/AcrR family transcriptional regulator [Mesoterricola sediminis]|uniref:TetR family transcriptional regulator n=1 Tax=Mesoterricola sediminis TaxID=2927980 RepID=A0AA48KCK0_9BACT|nr:TetR family transcriptional regulator [Mesoterricola sediminis]BDU76130.1 TetR family transcriptional regulator [Mesoterricola sediminis]